MTKTMSPLDEEPVYSAVKKALEAGVGPSELAKQVEDEYGIGTTKDSIRRFKDRHKIKVSAVKKVTAKVTKPKVAKKPTNKNLQYSIIKNEGDECITVFVPGQPPRVADQSHPSYAAIVEKAKADDIDVLDLFDVETALQKRFERLSERVLVKDRKIYFDGDEIHGALTDHIIRTLEQDLRDYKPLVKFLEKVMDNPIPHSREQLYRWLEAHKFSITTGGNIVAYKGVHDTGEKDDVGCPIYLSSNGGYAIVNGQEVNGRVPNKPGSTIEMPRTKVTHDPAVGCSQGLHVGTWNYASSFAPVVLECIVNPRDVVSVPTDCNDEKMRTCRYEIIGTTTEAYEAAVVLGEDR